MKKGVSVIVKNLTMKFSNFTAVDHISFSVNQGEIFGFLGANGAGKTTTIRMLCGLLVPTSGEAMIAGEDFRRGVHRIKQKVGYMSQKFTLYNDLTVAENIQFTGQLRKMTKTAIAARKRTLFNFVEFDQPETTLVKALPGGIKQQLALAAAILHDPEIVFLDEPTAGVAPAVRMRFWQLIHQLVNQGKTIFVTTHYMDEAEHCHRVALMRDGRIIANDQPERLKQQTFPEKMMEIDFQVGAARDWIQTLEQQPDTVRLKPYGRRYHALILDPVKWRTVMRQRPLTVSIRPIKPSLEDVFIRLVEG